MIKEEILLFLRENRGFWFTSVEIAESIGVCKKKIIGKLSDLTKHKLVKIRRRQTESLKHKSDGKYRYSHKD